MQRGLKDFCRLALVSFLFACALSTASLAGVKKVPYPEVKVTLTAAYAPDPAFERMRAAFADAVAKNDIQALSALVAPTFLWTIGSQPADQLDLGRDAVDNFKVVFGFRGLGKNEDGGVEGGPYWDALAVFAADSSYYAATDSGNLICGPMAAELTAEDAFEQARKTVETGSDGADWYFTLGNTDVAKSPGATGAPIAKIGTLALPLLSLYPAAQEGQPAPTPTYIEVLLPSGKSGWIAVTAMRPLFTDRLCYAKTPAGAWLIAAIDQAE